MSDVNLRYRANVAVDALELGECTVRKTRLAVATWWELWLFVPRDDCDDSEMVAVPVNVNGTFTEKGLLAIDVEPETSVRGPSTLREGSGS